MISAPAANVTVWWLLLCLFLCAHFLCLSRHLTQSGARHSTSRNPKKHTHPFLIYESAAAAAAAAHLRGKLSANPLLLSFFMTTFHFAASTADAISSAEKFSSSSSFLSPFCGGGKYPTTNFLSHFSCSLVCACTTFRYPLTFTFCTAVISFYWRISFYFRL